MRREDRLRAGLAAGLAKVHPSDDAWLSIHERLDRPIVVPVRRRIAIAAFALLVSAAGFLGIWAAFDGPSMPKPYTATEPRSVTTIPAVTGTFALGERGHMSSIAYGEGSVWVSVSDDAPSGTGTIVRMQPPHGDVLARIPVPVVPHWETGGGGLSVADGAAWIAGTTFDPDPSATVVRIDAATNDVSQVATVEGEVAADVVERAGVVWLLVRGDETTPMVHGIDAMTGTIESTIHLEGSYGRSIVAVGDSVFASVMTSSGEHGDAVDGTAVFQIDPESIAVTHREELPSIAAVAAGDGGLWAATGQDLVRFDVTSGAAAATYEGVNTGVSVAAGDGGVWFFGPAGEPRGLARLDGNTGEVQASSGDEGGDGIAVAIGPDSAWLVGYEGVVTRLQMVPDCPPVKPGVYDPSISPTSGSPGTAATIRGRVPMYAEDGAYLPPSGIVQVWWNVGSAGTSWTDLLPGGVAPSPALPGDVVLVAEARMPDACRYQATFAVPDAGVGTYPLTLVWTDGEGATSLGRGLEFRIPG